MKINFLEFYVKSLKRSNLIINKILIALVLAVVMSGNVYARHHPFSDSEKSEQQIEYDKNFCLVIVEDSIVKGYPNETLSTPEGEVQVYFHIKT